MKNRFFVPAEFAAGSIVSLAGEERHHARVLRLREGEEVEVFDGRGLAYSAVFQSPDAILLTKEVASRESHIALHLAMAVIQIDKFELVLQKATELGVASIIPLVTDRCEVRPERFRGKSERWEKILFEAAKQSGRSRIPPLEALAGFAEVLQRPGVRIVFDADEEPSGEHGGEPATLLIGPEGGWSEAELKMARDTDCLFRRLGPRRLRAETAAIVGLALVAAQSRDI